MNTQNILAILIFIVSTLFLYSFVLPFRSEVIASTEQVQANLAEAHKQASEQLALQTLRLKKDQLGDSQLSFLKTYVPSQLHTGQFIYNLSQLANQKRLTVKSLQYSVLSDPNKPDAEKKLLVEMTMDGKYEDFEAWLKSVEMSDVLIDLVAFRGSKDSNKSELITFYVKLYSYGLAID